MKPDGKAKLKSYAIQLLAAGIVTALLGPLYLKFTPRMYRADAKVSVEKNTTIAKTNVVMRFDATVIPAEIEWIIADTNLDQTIQKLGLSELWGRRNNQGAPLQLPQSRRLLKSKLRIFIAPGTQLLAIRSIADNPEEPPLIANELARIYAEHRPDRRKEVVGQMVEKLREVWLAQSRKVDAAQERVTQLYFDILKKRSTNQQTYMDLESYQLLQSRRINLESELVQKRQELRQLGGLDPESLLQSLTMVDTNNSPLLLGMLRKRNQARTDLITAKASHGDASREFRDATMALESANQRIERSLAAIMMERTNQILATQAAMDNINAKLKTASTNTAELTAQDAEYQSAQAELEKLRAERRNLEIQAYADASEKPALLHAIVAKIVDPAEPPTDPFSPDPRVANAAMIAGGVAFCMGLLLLITATRAKKPESKPNHAAN